MIAAAVLASSFLLGLLHTLEPCEDKLVVSIYTMHASRTLRTSALLVISYGLGMALIDSGLGYAAGWLGQEFLEGLETPAEYMAAIATIGFGYYIYSHPVHCHTSHLEPHHSLFQEKARSNALLLFLFGLIRGLPPCPFEVSMLVWAAALGDAVSGWLLVLTFGLGTTLGLVPLGLGMGGLAAYLAKHRKVEEEGISRFAGVAMILVGVALFVLVLFGVRI